MRIIDITHPPQSLWIGREGENTFRPVSFECANWFSAYPNATIAAYYQPYGVSDPYPLVLTVDGTKRIWHPTATELVKGNGELQIVLMLGGVVGTSAIIPTRVDRSLISEADHPADEAPSWTVQVVQDVTKQADRAEEAAESIGESIGEQLPGAIADYLEEHPVTVTETDPTVPAWAKNPQKPSYTAAEVGAMPDSYTPPVTSVNGKAGAVNLSASDVGALPDDTTIPSKTSDLTNDSGFVNAQQAAASAPVQSVNGKTGAVSLGAADVHALPDSTVIPPTVTEQTVAGWGFTKNTGTYSKPSGGIPKSDLAQDVQSSLGKADTAVQPSAISGMATETWVENKGYQTAPFEIEVTQSGLTYSTTASAADILAHIDNCVLVEDGTVLQQALHQVFGSYAVILFANNTSVLGYIANASFVVTIDGSNVSVDYYSADAQPELPSVTASDNGKFLRVVNGAWAAESVPFQTPRVAMTSSDTTPTLDPNKLYVFPTMASLALTLNTPSDNTIVNEYHFIFTSGSTATVLTLPSTVLQPDGFTVEANMHYEVSILEGAMTAQGWAVTST